MDESDKQKYKSLYIKTARQYVQDMQTNLTILLKGEENANAVSGIHLAAHSLASQSVMMGYTAVASASSAIEKTFKAKKEGHLSYDVVKLQIINDAVNKISHAVEEIDKSGHETDLTDEINQLAGILQT